MQAILSDPGILGILNRFFVSRLTAVIVEGETQAKMFQAAGAKSVLVVPNFAQENLFINAGELTAKFDAAKLKSEGLHVLFLSNMLPGKGHRETLEAYARIPPAIRSKIRLTFAGKVFDAGDRDRFVHLSHGVQYVGPVDLKKKIELFHRAHVFCLPTYYKYEGQPFVLSEAYAAGCVVVTTRHAGIGDIFAHDRNGVEVNPRDSGAIAAVLMQLAASPHKMLHYAQHNIRVAAERHREGRYLETITTTLARWIK